MVPIQVPGRALLFLFLLFAKQSRQQGQSSYCTLMAESGPLLRDGVRRALRPLVFLGDEWGFPPWSLLRAFALLLQICSVLAAQRESGSCVGSYTDLNNSFLQLSPL